jgi:hypothetical protein
MASDETGNLATRGATDSGEQKQEREGGFERLIKRFTALAALLGVVAGIWVSLKGLHDKNLADQKTAEIMLEDEKVKLKIAGEQTSQHQQDLDLQKQLHDADLQSKKESAEAQDARERTQRLADVITRVFTEKDSSAGQLSLLFEFLNGDRGSQQIIENAVLARLESPRSKEEIDIGFKLFERIGPSSFTFIASANRNARRRHDELLFERYARLLAAERSRKEKDPHPGAGAGGGRDAIDEAVAGDTLDREYLFATLNRMSGHAIPQRSTDSSSADKEEQDLLLRQQLAVAVIVRSNLAFKNCLRDPGCALPNGLDLSETYLEPLFLQVAPPNTLISHAYFSGVDPPWFNEISAKRSIYLGNAGWPDLVPQGEGCKPGTFDVGKCEFVDRRGVSAAY